MESYNLPVHISIVVLDELDGLKSRDDKVGKASRDAIRHLEEYQKLNLVHVVKKPTRRFLDENGLGTTKDDEIFGGYLKEMQDRRENYLYLSNDRMPRVKASSTGLAVFDYYG